MTGGEASGDLPDPTFRIWRLIWRLPCDSTLTDWETTMTTFDPVQFKTTTRQQWEDAAEAWHRWGPTIEAWTGEATQAMLDGAGVTTGSSVLDVAAGAGGQSLAAARRVGSDGRVVATDISPNILTFAAKQAAE